MNYHHWLALNKSLSDRKKRSLREHCCEEMLFNIEETELAGLGILSDPEIHAFLKSRDFSAWRDMQKGRLSAEGKKILHQMTSWENYEEWLLLQGIQIYAFADDGYPQRLRDLPAPPYALFVKGRLPEEENFAIAMVGARNCSSYGEAMAYEYAKFFAMQGIDIISGMARGIDSMAQRAALRHGGNSFAVLGCGVDVCYPRENGGLYADLLLHGGLISEQIPGTAPLSSHFPSRNRIISGLSDLILVIEAKEKSGSLITADLALEQGKDVYALPGPANSLLSRGCHKLIAQGAGILLSPKETLDELEIANFRPALWKTENEKKLETLENIVYSCVDFIPKNVDELAKESRLLTKEVLIYLVSLEMKGLIREISKNQYIRV